MATYIYFENFMRSLERMGVADILLPFLLIFTLIFAVLEKTKILGYRQRRDGSETKNPKTNLNTIVALVMGLGVVIPHATRSYPPGRDVVEILNNALPGVSLLVVAIFSFILLLGLWTGKTPDFAKSKEVSGVLILLMAVAVAGIFIASSNMYRLPRWLYFLEDPNIQAGLIVLVVFFGLIWFITRDEDKGDRTNEDSILSKLGKTFES